MRIHKLPLQCGGGRLRAGEVNLVVGQTATLLEVTVGGSHAPGARAGDVVEAHTGPAGGFRDVHAGGDQVDQQPLPRQQLQRRAAVGVDEEDIGVYSPPPDDAGHRLQVGVGAVGARAHRDLLHLRPRHLAGWPASPPSPGVPDAVGATGVDQVDMVLHVLGLDSHAAPPTEEGIPGGQAKKK